MKQTPTPIEEGTTPTPEQSPSKGSTTKRSNRISRNYAPGITAKEWYEAELKRMTPEELKEREEWERE